MSEKENYTDTIKGLAKSVYHENLLVSFIEKLQEVLGERFERVNDSTNIVGETLVELIESIESTSNVIEKTVENGEEEKKRISANNEEIISKLKKFGKDFDEVGKDVEKSLESVSHLMDNFQEIEELTNVIKNVAKQTNILSINASIEAARAKEAGRGFAVVAEEIKKLSSETNIASNKISERIVNLSNQVLEVKGIINNLEAIFSTITDSIEAALVTLNGNLAFMDELTQNLVSGKEELKENTNNLLASKENIEELVNNIHTLGKVLETVLRMQNKLKEIEI
ncbi:methyl-accepting chemotaxis sensory transducer [Petrotoga mobilis SJ95]|uniref:Methyl-accepting chemotaxis sensory transducer n=1 Tax=Petrotoga mobilis (strain DSM 10674 / SJ95) TaxID=403833 RepID=A9BFS8_PETMO|nr:methyl-accepting chemotaxis protein [Petrotoga mobilis]ABX31424.1 methyl-accepting chemotaxis sensory transducer [Petrotoga mobilis SJ95]